MIDLTAQRQYFAEELHVAANVNTPGLLDAFATVPRERFLPPGPWVIRSETDLFGPLRRTRDADPRLVYHNVSIGLVPDRMLFNGAPGFVGSVLEALALRPGHRVLHIGAGAGYYTAIAARTAGPDGRVFGIEIDVDLANAASTNLCDCGIDPKWAAVQQGDGTVIPADQFNAVLVNTGLTHIPVHWLERLAPGGRAAVPLTVTQGFGGTGLGAPAMVNISRGLMVLVVNAGDPLRYPVRVLTFVSIFTAAALRDQETNSRLTAALAKVPLPALTRLRFDPHEPDTTCWCHDGNGCWSTA